MEHQALIALELPKVLTCLAGFAVSEPGAEALLALRPYKNSAILHEEALFFEQGCLWYMAKNPSFGAFPPLEGLFYTLDQTRNSLDLDALFALRQVLAQGKGTMDSFICEGTVAPWDVWQKRCENIAKPTKCFSALFRCLSDDGYIKDEASPELILVRGELRRLHQQCMRKVKDFATEYNIGHYLQDAFMTLSSDRYVLPIKTNFKGRLQGVIHDYSQTGETCYFEPLFLVEINNRLQELKQEEREEENKILRFLTELVHQERASISSVYHFLIDVDILLAKKQLGQCYDGRLVALEKDAPVSLLEAKHPLLALHESKHACEAWNKQLAKDTFVQGVGQIHTQELEQKLLSPRHKGSAIASTLELKKNQLGLVISGGNAGGKTVCLKTLGLIALMVGCALPVPVEAGSILPEWSRIYAFIGDEQSLEDHVSTFTAQISHLARIWPFLDASCLVILDEFGAGTDPSQGAALAQAVVDEIMSKNAYVVSATHFPALKAYALSTPKVRAASVLFDPRTQKPLFRLAYDQVGESQALAVAQKHGLPESILRKAEQYLLLGGEDTSTLMDRLNTLAVERENELEVLKKNQTQLAEKQAKLTEKIIKEKALLFAKVQEQAQEVLQDWKKGRTGHRPTLKALASIRQKIQEEPEEQKNTPDSTSVNFALLVVGQTIFHVPWNKTAEILEIDEKKEKVRLGMSGVSLWADGSHLRLLENTQTSQKHFPPNSLVTQQNSAKKEKNVKEMYLQRLDLRGLRADVAISTLDKNLDGAIVSGHTHIEVIHGRGTGVLRKEVHEYLQNAPMVATFELAPEDQGGDGMTIVVLK